MATRLLVTLAAVLVSTPATAVDISTCGQVVPRNQVGVLIADLDCPPVVGVDLESGATLQLDGHTITMTNGVAVRCAKAKCTIEGPGVLEGQHSAGSGVSLLAGARLAMRDVTIQNFVFGIYGADRNKADLEQVTIEGTQGGGIDLEHRSRIKANGLTIRNAVGTIGRALNALVCLGSDWTITDNDVTIGLEQSGIVCGRARLTGLVATGNRGAGAWFGNTGTLSDSTVTGNGLGGAGIDVVSTKRPRLRNTTCGRSSDRNGTTAWGVCAND